MCVCCAVDGAQCVCVLCCRLVGSVCVCVVLLVGGDQCVWVCVL